MAEFFQLDWGEKNSAPVPLRSQCDACGLYRRCHSPKMPVDGEGRKGILIVSEFPGHEEDQYGRPLVGNTGKEVQSILRKHGIDMRKDCWLTNALICFPNGKAPNGATEFCRPNLLQTIKELSPRVIILMGGMAVQSLIGHLWKPSIGSVERWVGWQIPCRVNNCYICPTYQPAWMFHNNDPVLRMELERHLADAVALEGRPWDDGIPDYERQIEIIHSPTEAAERLARYTKGTIVFDYETNCLKPWSKGKIYSCSVCWEGKETIAFPWSGPAILEMSRILSSPHIRRWAYNDKFESLWTVEKLGVHMKTCEWDGMLAAHALDPRGNKDGEKRKDQAGITGLKFQSYVLLGMPDYNSHIEPYLHSTEKSGYSLNRIHELDKHELLKYNALDSLLEWEVCRKQRERMGIKA